MGALAAAGHFSFAGIFWFGEAGAVLGDNLNYWIGQCFGQRLIDRGFSFLKPGHLQQAHAFIDRHGAKSVFLGRFIPNLKEFVPFLVGIGGMP